MKKIILLLILLSPLLLIAQQEATQDSLENEPIFVVVEKMPQFPGGEKAMFDFITQNLRWPVIASEMAISGRIILQFVVEKNGNITHIKVIRSLDEAFDDEAIRVIKLMPRWIPAEQRGHVVRCYFVLPVHIDLR